MSFACRIKFVDKRGHEVLMPSFQELEILHPPTAMLYTNNDPEDDTEDYVLLSFVVEES